MQYGSVVGMQVDYQEYSHYPFSMNPDSGDMDPFFMASMGHFPLNMPVMVCRSKVYGAFGASWNNRIFANYSETKRRVKRMDT